MTCAMEAKRPVVMATLYRLVRAVWPSVLLCGFLGPGVFGAPPVREEYTWDNPVFRERFTGSYGVLSGVEPAMDSEDRAFLRERILPLIAEEPGEAHRLLAERLRESASAPFYFLLGNLDLEQGNLESARKNLQAALGLYPDFRRARLSLALLEFRADDPVAAVPHLREVIRLGGGDDQTYGLLGYAYLQEGYWTAAARAFENALVHRPRSADLRRGLAHAYLQTSRTAEAAEVIRKLLAEDPGDSQLWELLANRHLAEGDMVRTAAALEAAERLAGASPERLLLLGGVYSGLGLPEQASSAYGRLLDLPVSELSFEDALEPLSLMLDQREWARAEDYGRRLREHFGRDLDASQANRVNAGLAVAQLNLRPSEAAARTVSGYATHFPMDGLLFLSLGDYQAANGAVSDALLSYRRAAEDGHLRYEALLRLANLLVAEGRYGEAVTRFRELQEIQYRTEVARFIGRLEGFIR